jgi:broad specificity phosphatase PhoE
MELNNKYFLLRHGEAFSNVNNIVSSWPEKIKNPLTTTGRDQIKKVSKKLKSKNIDLIFSSDVLRTKQTSEIVSESLGLKVKFDKRLREIDFGVMSGGSAEEFIKLFKDRLERVLKGAPKGESYKDVFERVLSFIKEINKKYKGKNILIISHQAPLYLLEGAIDGFSVLEIIKKFPKERMLHRGGMREIIKK